MIHDLTAAHSLSFHSVPPLASSFHSFSPVLNVFFQDMWAYIIAVHSFKGCFNAKGAVVVVVFFRCTLVKDLVSFLQIHLCLINPYIIIKCWHLPCYFLLFLYFFFINKCSFRKNTQPLCLSCFKKALVMR